MKNNKVYIIAIIIFVGIAISGSSCKKSEPIKIGFSGTLTGRGTNFGTRSRNAPSWLLTK